MHILPYEKFVYSSPLTEEEIKSRLNKAACYNPKLGLLSSGSNSGNKPFEGRWEEHAFVLRRIITYRNSFAPLIFGKIRQTESGVEIDMKIRLHRFVSTFIIVWCSIAFMLGLPFLFSFFYTLYIVIKVSVLCGSFDLTFISTCFSWDIVPLMQPIFMIFFAYALVMVGYWLENRKAKKLLSVILEAAIQGKTHK